MSDLYHWNPKDADGNEHQHKYPINGNVYLVIGTPWYITAQYRPTIRSSISEAFFRMRVQISMVKIVEDELKIDVNELISAANITANMRPVRPALKKKFPQ